MPLRVLLADDHKAVRQGLRALLEREDVQVIAEAADGQEAIEQVRALRPDAAVLDLSMPRLNGLDAAREMGRSLPGIRIILLTVHTENAYVMAALRAGIKGYVLKNQASTDLRRAIREVAGGRRYLSPGISQAVVDACLAGADLPVDPFNARERRVLQLVAEGKTTSEVAHALGISTRTADSHRRRIMRKLDVHETASLVRHARRLGLV